MCLIPVSESIVESNKHTYYLSLRQTQLTLKNPTPEWEPWIVFFLKCLLSQTQRLTAKIETERTALASLTPLARAITEMLETESRTTVAQIVAVTHISRNTIKQTLSKSLCGRSHCPARKRPRLLLLKTVVPDIAGEKPFPTREPHRLALPFQTGAPRNAPKSAFAEGRAAHRESALPVNPLRYCTVTQTRFFGAPIWRDTMRRWCGLGAPLRSCLAP